MFIGLLVLVAVRMFTAVPSRGDELPLTAPTVLLLLVVGLVMGLTAGLFGVGGGIVVVPALVVLVGVGDLLAKGTSLLVMVPTTIAGTVANARRADGRPPGRSRGRAVGDGRLVRRRLPRVRDPAAAVRACCSRPSWCSPRPRWPTGSSATAEACGGPQAGRACTRRRGSAACSHRGHGGPNQPGRRDGAGHGGRARPAHRGRGADARRPGPRHAGGPARVPVRRRAPLPSAPTAPAGRVRPAVLGALAGLDRRPRRGARRGRRRRRVARRRRRPRAGTAPG